MRKKPAPARKAAPPPPVWHPVPVAVQIRQHRAAVKAAHAKAAARKPGPGPGVNPGGVMIPATAGKPAAKKKVAKRKLAGPRENCVADACYALTGRWLDPGGDDGLFIPGALEMLQALGLITGFAPADLDDDSPGLILGVDLPGPHAVVVTPDAWWSWGEPYDPAAFPQAVIEEAWEVTW